MRRIFTFCLVYLCFISSSFSQGTTEIKRIQYYYNTDPGVGIAGNGAVIDISPPTANLNQNFNWTIPSSLNYGMHNLYIRVQDQDNSWSLIDARPFYILENPSFDIDAYEYYVDTDPGVGNGNFTAVTAANSINEQFTLSTTGLSDGMHILYVRVRNTDGHWSLIDARPFYILETPSFTITDIEYYFDNDPGVGNGTLIPLTPTSNLNQLVNISLPPSLSNGMHLLYVRVRNSEGDWSLTDTRPFFIGEFNPPEDIVCLEYFIDSDPGLGNGTSIPVSPSSMVDSTFSLILPCLSVGTHHIFIRAKDEGGEWSLIDVEEFNVQSTAGPEICGDGIDNDCDGLIDEASGEPEICDGIDNNCDGLIDEGFDDDNDGVANCFDNCPNDPLKTEPGICGCGTADTDTDGDGTADCDDNCPSDPLKTEPGICGCGVADIDTDGDGTADCIDNCPSDPLKIEPGICGCGTVDTDSDLDGTADCNDNCPNDPLKTEPGICGCGTADTDMDGDGTADCDDNCPSDPLKTEPGICGCGVADIDTDGDGTADCIDNCPSDPLKIEPGNCGCGTPDTDTDMDGTADCNDNCPNDPLKTDPGICGCGTADTDTDGDGTADCNDNCPNDPLKTEPGICGCGTPDADSDMDGIADCNDAEECDGIDNDGDGDIDEGFDADSNGIADCFEIEICNGIDDDGDGLIDEGFDLDGDGLTTCAGDCDDNDPTLTFDCCTNIQVCDDGNPCTENDMIVYDNTGAICVPCQGTVNTSSCEYACGNSVICDDGDTSTLLSIEVIAADGSICQTCTSVDDYDECDDFTIQFLIGSLVVWENTPLDISNVAQVINSSGELMNGAAFLDIYVNNGILIYNDVQEIPFNLTIGKEYSVAYTFYNFTEECTITASHSFKILSLGCAED